ncbi:Putative sugar phosphate/phosphate translocator [Picochlorum sp. SENEW3]|nr:Putative sugar phosphate/phosphate translocator [Picochlorum sp. SENEW3]WPT14981.1 Putative sugar phosphate/phosphate translocator [Picochlorum sp. SENEW3]
MSFSFIVLAPFAIIIPLESHTKTLQKEWKGIFYIGSLMALSIALNNISLVGITLSLNQVIRSSLPVITCLLSVFIEKQMPTIQEAISLLILSVGVMIAVWQGTIAGKPQGILFCISSTVCSAMMMTFSGKLLSENLEVVRLTFYTAPVSLICLSPFTACVEMADLSNYLKENSARAIVILLMTSINAVAYNIVHYLMIKKSSSVITTVLGEIKVVGLLILSTYLFEEGKDLTPKMITGCVIAMLGLITYSQMKIKAFQSN